MNASGRLYRSKEQARVVVPIAVAMSLASLIPLVDPHGFPWWFFLAASVAWALLAWRLARAGVVVDSSGVLIRNPLSRSRRLLWEQVTGFRLGRHGMFPAMGFVDTPDGNSIHIWGIQAPNPTFRPNDAATEQLIAELTRLQTEAQSRTRTI